MHAQSKNRLTVSHVGLAGVAGLAVQFLITSAAINPQAMAQSAAEQSQGLRQGPQGGLLTPEEALVWYAVLLF